MYPLRPLALPLFFCFVSLAADQSFTMRTSEPVMVENTVLPAGTYTWRRLESRVNPNIVQIRNEDTRRVQATILAIGKYRQVASAQNELDFWETPTGSARAVRSWFAPGENFGQEFPYPRNLALIQRNPSAVARLNVRAAAVETIAEPARSHADRNPKSEAQEGSWAVITDGTPPSSQPAAAQKKTPSRGTIWDALSRLPLTATIMPLIGLIGLGSMLLLLLSYVRRKKRQDNISAY